MQPAAELRRTQINVYIHIHTYTYIYTWWSWKAYCSSRHTTTNHGSQLRPSRCWFYEGGHPSSYNSRPTRLNLKFSGERQRANRICHPCFLYVITTYQFIAPRSFGGLKMLRFFLHYLKRFTHSAKNPLVYLADTLLAILKLNLYQNLSEISSDISTPCLLQKFSLWLQKFSLRLHKIALIFHKIALWFKNFALWLQNWICTVWD